MSTYNYSSDPAFAKMSEGDIADLKQFFSLFDCTGDMQIQAVEIPNVFTLMLQSPNNETIRRAIEARKIDVDSVIDFPTFAKVVRSVEPYSNPKKRIVKSLQVLSLNSKLISRDLLRRCLLTFGATMPESEISELLDSVPCDGKGNINIEALADFLVS